VFNPQSRVRSIARNYLRAFHPGFAGLHGDRILRTLVRRLVNRYGITACIETGTYQGETAIFLARLNPSLPVYTCEIDGLAYEAASARFVDFANIMISRSSSPSFLKDLIDAKCCGELPLFWLDAHWLEYWPLRDELALITNQPHAAVIMIDDFEVPGKPQFGFDSTADYEAGAGVSEPIACGTDYVRPALNSGATYTIWLPAYHRKQAFPFWDLRPLRGYSLIIMNSPSLSSSLEEDPFLRRFFELQGPLCFSPNE